MKAWVRKHPIVGYVVLAYAITWLIASPLVFSAQNFVKLSVPFTLHYLTAYVPLAAAIIMTAITEGMSGLRELLDRMLRWRVGLVWVLISAFSLIALFAVVFVAVYIAGGGLLDMRLLGAVNYLPNLGFGAWAF